jgi:CRP-like cAMP-binding protein
LPESIEKINGKATTTTLKAGDYFGVESLTDKVPYSATVVALDTTCCYKLDKATLKHSVPSLNRSFKNMIA